MFSKQSNASLTGSGGIIRNPFFLPAAASLLLLLLPPEDAFPQVPYFELSPTWLSGLTKKTEGVALGDVDGDGYLDLVCGNIEDGNSLYLNEGGVFRISNDWISDQADSTYSVALGDIDGDGDLDLVCGNYAASNTVYLNGKSGPAFKGDPLLPVNQLPNNGAHLRNVTFEKIDLEYGRVEFAAVDVESDSVWIVPEYQFEGNPVWYPVISGGRVGKTGLYAASPEGVTGSFFWETKLLQFDERPIILRLRIVEVPRRVSIVQHVAPYLLEVGHLKPYRPEISTSLDSLRFPTVSFGDTVSSDVVIGNTGNVLLSVSSLDLPSSEMRLSRSAPFDLSPSGMDTVTFYLEPRTETGVSGEVLIQSNDPLHPVRMIRIDSDIRPLDVRSRLLAPAPEVPLGEALTVIVTPA